MQCIVTSPPYWGLRDYGVSGQLGLEATPQEYVERMVEVFRLARELLADDGVLWLNLGDSYAPVNRGENARPRKETLTGKATIRAIAENGIKQKDLRCAPGRAKRWRVVPGSRASRGVESLWRFSAAGRPGPAKQNNAPCPSAREGLGSPVAFSEGRRTTVGIPWMVAFALRADGWYLRSEIIWHKVAPMPESVRDRPTRAHEQVFLLAKSERYFYNTEAARDPLKETSIARLTQPNYDEQEGSELGNGGAKTNGKMKAVAAHFGGRNKSQINDQTRLASGNEWQQDPAAGANWRDVWPIAADGYREAHFAVMPSKLVERCILAGSRPGDIVFDPFFGSGTTGQVAEQMGRQWIGAELNPAYEPLQKRRTAQTGMAL